jgi:hypothetical protein
MRETDLGRAIARRVYRVRRLTIHSSRTRFVAARLQAAPRAGRLNSGVRFCGQIMNTHAQRAAIGAASAAVSLAGIFTLLSLDIRSDFQDIALALFALSFPAHLLFSLIQQNMLVENNPRNPVVSTFSFWSGQSALLAALTISVWSGSRSAGICLLVASLISLMGYGYAAKADGRKT